LSLEARGQIFSEFPQDRYAHKTIELVVALLLFRSFVGFTFGVGLVELGSPSLTPVLVALVVGLALLGGTLAGLHPEVEVLFFFVLGRGCLGVA